MRWNQAVGRLRPAFVSMPENEATRKAHLQFTFIHSVQDAQSASPPGSGTWLMLIRMGALWRISCTLPK